ncbi:MAG: AbrB/MazE/SpoVT family DNA-binding domain-containing protein [Candidatus Tectomicrobia bacterium]|uniref:AbrB/MazE/SpoVT family DNA-binding domain-containing protein n=1 Tax=Tectimicrobiota bacterium TaxID=2528274 RepID=A0A937W790_UNCTE|nr:AbrB/MazE/SpoVT family DNA-binding domain-containing protein [Candidatus Tectomicrobia bacterium]
MLKKLTPIGNSLGIIIEWPILELLGIDKDTPLDLTTDGEALLLRPARADHRQRIQRVARHLMDTHDVTCKRLAE